MNLPVANTDLLKTRQHFEILDGLRGIAAVAVVIFHFMEFAVPDYHNNFIAHAYLAVDFFFCLSGFVIAYAYDNKLAEIGIGSFFKLRLIRLHPLVIIGSVLGLLSFIFDPFSNLYEKFGAGQTMLMFITSCFLIPYPILPERYFNLFHLNPPTWSLFWEYIANIFYAVVLIKLRNKLLWILTIIAAGLLIYEAQRSHQLSVGWGGDNVIGGAIRVLFSFLAGMLVYRANLVIKSTLGFFWIGLLLMMTFLVPFSDKVNFITDPVIAIICFPLLVALGAGAHLSERFKKICTFSGDISYPLYMIHYPFLWLFFSYIEKEKPSMFQMEIIIPIGVILLIVFAYLTMVYVDLPIRKFLKNNMRKNLK